ncbi:type III secretion system stalk subunit SctO [Pseudochelatococcus sp. B33]
MIGQMKALLRIKELKQERALSAMHAKRAQLEQARLETARALEIAETFKAEMPDRENRIYDEVMGRVVTIDGIDGVREKIADLLQQYTDLKDDWERARGVEARLEEELRQATQAYRAAVRDRDKYVTIVDTMQKEAIEAAEAREEIEIEDLFAKPTRKVA